VLPLASGEAIKLTTALYYTPSGRSIQAEGIEPDVVLQPAELRPLGAGDRPVTEADLPGHLGNDNGKPAATPSASAANTLDESSSRDFVLTEALNILRALARWNPPAASPGTAAAAATPETR